MIVSAHQPAYLPWAGYFDKIARADVHVFLDDVQFEKNSFINRNKIKTAQGPQWLTIPVRSKGHTDRTLRDSRVNSDVPWREKHLRAIAMSYSKAPFFKDRFSRLEGVYTLDSDLLAEICWEQLSFWLNELQISTRIVRQTELEVQSTKSQLVLDLCQKLEATRYISGALGRDYLDVESFAVAGIEVEFQSYAQPEYTQLYGEFIPALSIVDAWFNCQRVEL